MKRAQSAHSAHRRLIVVCGVIPVIIAAVLALYRPTSLATLDNSVYDTLLRWARAKPPGGRVVIVDVDERSLSAIGQWPWRRDVIARLVARLRDMGASAIVLDIIFAESDRYEGQGRSEERSNAAIQATPDDVLAETLRKGRVVLGYGLTFDAAGSTHAFGALLAASNVSA